MNSFEGRRRELDLFNDLLEAAIQEARCKTVVLSGSLGMGKSALLDEFILHKTGLNSHLRVARAQLFPEKSESILQQLVTQWLQDLEVNRPTGKSLGIFRRTLQESMGEILTAVPVVGDVLNAFYSLTQNYVHNLDNAEALATIENYELLLANLLDSAIDNNITLLIVEDGQHLDMATKNLLFRRIRAFKKPILIVLAMRTDDLSLDKLTSQEAGEIVASSFFPQLDNLPEEERKRAIVFHHLARLEDDEMRMIAEPYINEGKLLPQSLELLLRNSEGNPLSLLLSIKTNNYGIERVDKEVAIDQLIEGIESKELRLLEKASVIGREFEVELLAELAGISEREVFDLLAGLIDDRGLVLPCDASPLGKLRYRFSSGMFFDAFRRRVKENEPLWLFLNAALVGILLSTASSTSAVDVYRPRIVDAMVASPTLSLDEHFLLENARYQLTLESTRTALLLSETLVKHAKSSMVRRGALKIYMEALMRAGKHQLAASECGDWLDQHRGLHSLYSFEIALKQARSLRMLASWDILRTELESLICALYKYKSPPEEEEHMREIRANALMLRAEMELCGPESLPDACISTCSQVLSLSKQHSLRSRSYGHQALSSLVLERFNDAEEFFRRAEEEAEETKGPHDRYEVIHWKSKFNLALCRLGEVSECLNQLEEISSRYGIADEVPYHWRDKSRLLGLQQRFSESAEYFFKYYCAVKKEQSVRALATLVCQVEELDHYLGTNTGRRRFCASLETKTDRMHDEAIRLVLRGLQKGNSAPYEEQCREYQLDTTEAQVARAIFFFDVPDLHGMREKNNGIEFPISS